MSLIYIVEDDTDIREIESMALTNSGHTTELFENAAAFFARVQEKLPDLVVLDIMLPDRDGNDVLKMLRAEERTRRVPVILVTAKTSEIDMLRGLDGGADDYIGKPFSVLELISRVRAVLRRTEPDGDRAVKDNGQNPEEPDRTGAGGILLDPVSHRVFVRDTVGDRREVFLTNREFELLRYLMQHEGRVLTRDMLLSDVWDLEYAGETRTVDVHIRTLRQKLGSQAKCIETVRGVGYRFEGGST